MAAGGLSTRQIVGIVLIALGVLLLAGFLSLGPLVPLIGVVLIIVGILALVGYFNLGKEFGVGAIVIGAILVSRIFGIAWLVGKLADIIIGILLIVLGISRLKR